MSKQGGKCLRGVAVGLVAGLVALLVWRLGWLDSLEYPSWAWRARFFSQRESLSSQVKLIVLDQASLEWGRRENDWGWPWPTEVYGAISAFCKRGGARVLCLDKLMTESSIYGVPDDELAGQAFQTGAPVVLPIAAGASQEVWPDYMRRPGLKTGLPSMVEFPSMVFPVREVARGAAATGHVAGRPDEDGVFRRMSPVCRFDDVEIPSLGLAGWLTASQQPVVTQASSRGLQVGDKTIPLDEYGNAILRFKGQGGLPECVSIAAVVQSELRLRDEAEPVLNPDIFKDCYVFMGGSAPALLDLHPVPVNAKCPGVVLHATFVDNLLTDSFMAKGTVPAVAVGILATAIASALSLTYGGRWWQTGFLWVVWSGVPVLVGFAAYARGIWWPMAAHETAVGLGLVGALAANYLTEGRQKAFIKQAFQHYLSGDLIERMLRDPKHLQLGGEKRELTIMFTDLAGFSTFSERLEPIELTALLNDYLGEMTDIIMEEGATLDKYEGDAIIAFWNAPVAQPDHAIRTCRAALRCQRRLAELRGQYQQRTGAELRMRVGIHTGDVVVGNMGSRKRFNYTILGDAANLASRLEGANKAFGTEMLVSESTWNVASSEFCGRKLADLRVFGRNSTVAVYELTGFADDAAPAGWAVFGDGLACFQQGDFAGAMEIFQRLPDDPAAQHYTRRCSRLCAEPPASWDGVWEMTGK